jgi:hypothetical protein
LLQFEWQKIEIAIERFFSQKNVFRVLALVLDISKARAKLT